MMLNSTSISDKDVLVESGTRKKAKIVRDKYGMELFVMMNGWQWNGTGVDDEMLMMIRTAIENYFKVNERA